MAVDDCPAGSIVVIVYRFAAVGPRAIKRAHERSTRDG